MNEPMYGMMPPDNALVFRRTTPWFSSDKYTGIKPERYLGVNYIELEKHVRQHGTNFDIYFFINFLVFDHYRAYKISCKDFMALQTKGQIRPYKFYTKNVLMLGFDCSHATLIKKLTRKEYIEISKNRREAYEKGVGL